MPIQPNRTAVNSTFHPFLLLGVLVLVILSPGCQETSKKQGISSGNLFEYTDQMEPHWSSSENRNGAKGAGGKENYRAKGHPFDSIPAGQSLTLLDTQGQGIIHRIWITIRDRSPEMLRSLKIEMFWDDEKKPAVSAPFGDFFGVGLGKTTAFQNSLFANAEGRSFNCFIPMPFKKAARIVVTNESTHGLSNIFFDVDYNLLTAWNDDYLYFHAFWQRDTATALARDFEILPRINGRGRFLGVNMGVSANPQYKKSWFGEGEVKIYLNGDTDYPTLNGTGTEDYIGTAWGQGKFINTYAGCSIADDSLLQWAFYRYHIPDPIYFKTDCRVTMQQLGGDDIVHVMAYQKAGAPLIPVTIDDGRQLHPVYQPNQVVKLDTTTMPKGWTNFYRSDDVSATAYFYLNSPTSNLPALQPVTIRASSLRSKR